MSSLLSVQSQLQTHQSRKTAEAIALLLTLIITNITPAIFEFFCRHQFRAFVLQALVNTAVASWLALISCLLPYSLRLGYIWILLVLTTTLISLSIAHILLFGTHPTDAVYLSIFNTHFAELSEFIDAYITPTLSKRSSLAIIEHLFQGVMLSIVFALLHLMVWRGYLRARIFAMGAVLSSTVCRHFCSGLIGFTLLSLLGSQKLPCGPESAISYSVYAPVVLGVEYASELTRNREAVAIAPRKQLEPISQPTLVADRPQTYVIIIGEAINRNHMGIYGYQRDTTPELSKLSREVLSFSNAYSKHCHTHTSLKSALSFHESVEPTPFAVIPSLIDLMNFSGYKTFWISNQVAFGRWNTPVAEIARHAQEVQFLNPEQLQLGARSFDEVVLPPFLNALSDAAPRKFIVVHLRGAHAVYANRYPPGFVEFSGPPPPTQIALDDKMVRLINQYDTAIRYTDHVVASLIAALRESTDYSALLFFADHGEEVFDFRDFYGHNETIASRFMFEIPLVIWGSPSYLRDNSALLQAATNNLSKSFVLTHLVDSIQDLTATYSLRYNRERSLLSSQYASTPFVLDSPSESAEADLCRFSLTH